MASTKNAIIAGISGTALQWYDFAIFGYFAPIIASTYFPSNNPLVSLLNAFAMLAVGYLLAPLGSLFFGFIGDRLGRKKALGLSILGMAVPTATIGMIPSYQHIGLLAPLLIASLRIIQGFVASAEYTGSTVFLVEHAPAHRKALYGCLTSSAYSTGSILAGFSASFFTASFMPAWAWRFGFAIALLAGIVIFFLRRQVAETPEYQQIRETDKPKQPMLTALKEVPLVIVGVIGLAWFTGIITFGTYVFTATYFNTYFHISLSTASLIISFALIIDAILEPFIATIADKIGFNPVIRGGMIAMMILSIPIFYALSSGNIMLTSIGLFAMSSLIAIVCAPLNAYMVSLFPKQYRYSGFGVAFHIGISLFGATTPLVMIWLIGYTGNYLSPAWYYIFGTFVGISALSLCEFHQKKIYKITAELY